jgi:hypothetical protein
MRHLARFSILGLSVALLAAPAGAQYTTSGGYYGSYSHDASLDVPPVAPGVAALAVRYGGVLQLSQKQLDVIEAVRQQQDSADAPWVHKLDSLRNAPRPVNPLDLSQEQREQVAAQRAAIKSALAAMRGVDADARTKVMGVLTPDQQAKAGQLEHDAMEIARARAQEPRAYQRDSYGRRGGNQLILPPGA